MSELDLLKEMCDSVPPQREQARARARSRLLAAAGGASPTAPRRRPRARVRLALAGSAVTVAVVAAALAGGLITGGHGDHGQPASAAELLLLAAAAPAPPAPRPESGCKAVIGQRLKLSGMRWTVAGADAITTLRCQQASRPEDQIWPAPRNQAPAA